MIYVSDSFFKDSFHELDNLSTSKVVNYRENFLLFLLDGVYKIQRNW